MTEVNNTAHAAWAKENIFDFELKKRFVPAQIFLHFLRVSLLLGSLRGPLPAKSSSSTHGCFSDCHNRKKEAPGGRLTGIKKNRERDGTERGEHIELKAGVIGKGPSPEGAGGVDRALSVKVRDIQREEEMPCAQMSVCFTMHKYKGAILGNVLGSWRFTCYSDPTLCDSSVVFQT